MTRTLGGVRGALRQLLAEPSTRLQAGVLPSCLSVSVGKDILFCNFWWCGGSCELQMCMAFSVGIGAVILDQFNFGVLESGSIVGLSNFIMIGIGKSTPVKIASPSPRIGKKSNVFLLAVLQALLTASLSL